MNHNDNVKVGDVIVILDNTSRKKVSGGVESIKNNQIRVESVDALGEAEYHEFLLGEDSKILANLGSNPAIGSVYGCQIRKLYSQTDHEFWGRISIMRQVTDDEKEILKRIMKTSYARIRAMGLEKVIHIDNFLVCPPKGRWAGWYKQDRKGYHICLQPKDFAEYAGTIITDHELAHAIWYQVVQDHKQAKWVQLYNQYTKIIRAPGGVLSDVIDIVSSEARKLDEYHELISEVEHGSEWLSSLEYALMDIHLLDRKDLDLYIWSLNNKQRRKALERAAQNIGPLSGEHDNFPVSDYAATNTREFFAEAFCHYLNDQSIPEEVSDLLIDTIPRIKAAKGLKFKATKGK